MLGEELIEAHENPRLVPPFSERHPGLTPEAGYAGLPFAGLHLWVR